GAGCRGDPEVGLARQGRLRAPGPGRLGPRVHRTEAEPGDALVAGAGQPRPHLLCRADADEDRFAAARRDVDAYRAQRIGPVDVDRHLHIGHQRARAGLQWNLGAADVAVVAALRGVEDDERST